ncbi:STAS domain-containing protein [Jatrophihabitans endophyticus]|uniref:STAS domain-containing protein n=1 Tax=Jatrophihabitans endophyticus TaxID=1206085 RepID=UPI0019DF06D2|nr:STAS domain-containing protein [Jatrophihabitans endophyticus]MBE7187011.1 STAS domain-containing protein [Jatrophihabitans endophyticus]
MRVVVPWSGEIDLATVWQLQADACAAVRRPNVDEVELDLSAVTFMDSTGLSALLVIRGYALEDGVRLILTGITERLARLLEFTGLTAMFESA